MASVEVPRYVLARQTHREEIRYAQCDARDRELAGGECDGKTCGARTSAKASCSRDDTQSSLREVRIGNTPDETLMAANEEEG